MEVFRYTVSLQVIDVGVMLHTLGNALYVMLYVSFFMRDSFCVMLDWLFFLQNNLITSLSIYIFPFLLRIYGYIRPYLI